MHTTASKREQQKLLEALERSLEYLETESQDSSFPYKEGVGEAKKHYKMPTKYLYEEN